MNNLNIIGRDKHLFSLDIEFFNEKLKGIVSNSRFLVIGGAGSIGQAVSKEIFKRNPRVLHVVDISENNMAIEALSIHIFSGRVEVRTSTQNPFGDAVADVLSNTHPVIWIANSEDSTATRMNTETGCEEARYYVCGNPSRTAVDKDGNGFITCRADGIVAKIAIETKDCVDTNGNGTIELPELAAIGRYVPYRLVGNMLYVSGSSARPRYQTFPTAPKHVPTAPKNTGSCC